MSVVQPMASPALAVKAGRSRGTPVIERLHQEEAELARVEQEAAAKRKQSRGNAKQSGKPVANHATGRTESFALADAALYQTAWASWGEGVPQ